MRRISRGGDKIVGPKLDLFIYTEVCFSLISVADDEGNGTAVVKPRDHSPDMYNTFERLLNENSA